MSGNKAKEEHLGMSLGKANNILRKSIMFYLLQKLGEDYCFKCSLKIEHVDDLSVEHKIPWLYNDTHLYWDLDNIAFSHLKCNRPNRPNYKGNDGTIVTITGDTKRCSRCKVFKNLKEFTKNNGRASGYQSECKECRPANPSRLPRRQTPPNIDISEKIRYNQ